MTTVSVATTLVTVAGLVAGQGGGGGYNPGDGNDGGGRPGGDHGGGGRYNPDNGGNGNSGGPNNSGRPDNNGGCGYNPGGGGYNPGSSGMHILVFRSCSAPFFLHKTLCTLHPSMSAHTFVSMLRLIRCMEVRRTRKSEICI